MSPTQLLTLVMLAVPSAVATDDVEVQKIKQLHPTSRTVYQTFTELRSFLSLGMLSHLVTCPDQFACILRRDGQTIGLLNESSAYLSNGLQVSSPPTIFS